ncbi:hypothetical protein ILYODFUR_011428 [Ilyodon furcidens]|uniref:Uncharacterized protein n=1 Tax=Ilyodon furcidens TaxID=33524 RepID=A0ABV0UTU6_9TELE
MDQSTNLITHHRGRVSLPVLFDSDDSFFLRDFTFPSLSAHLPASLKELQVELHALSEANKDSCNLRIGCHSLGLQAST